MERALEINTCMSRRQGHVRLYIGQGDKCTGDTKTICVMEDRFVACKQSHERVDVSDTTYHGSNI